MAHHHGGRPPRLPRAVTAATPEPAQPPAPVEAIDRADPSPALVEAVDTILTDQQPAARNQIMDTATTTDAARTAFTEAADRAQAGVAKGQAFFADMGDFNKGNVEAMVESSRIAAKGFEAMGRDAAAFARGSFDDAQAQARSLASATSPAEFLRLQGDYARQSFDRVVAETSRGTEAFIKLAGEIAQPLSNRMAVAADRIKVAA